MEKKKNGLKKFAVDFVRELFAPQEEEKPTVAEAAKKTLADLKIEDLSRERVRMERKEQEFLQRISKISHEKKVLFEKGVKSAGEIEQAVMARRIIELDEEAKNVNQMLKSISKQKRLIHALTLAEERSRMLSRNGLQNLGEIDLAELITHIEDVSLESDVQEQNIDGILSVLSRNQEFAPEMTEDPEVIKLMEKWQRIRESGEDISMVDIEENRQTLDDSLSNQDIDHDLSIEG